MSDILKNIGNFLIVDNEQEEIEKLTKKFKSFGIKPETLLYKLSEKRSLCGNDYRVIFFDLNISQISITTGDNSTAYSHLETALSEVIPLNNVPYIIVFWTKHEGEIPKFRKYLTERGSLLKNCQHPIQILSLNKVDFEAHSNPDELLADLLKDTIFYKLLEFEELLKSESASLVSQIINIACSTPKDIWQEDVLQNFLRTLTIQHSGFDIAKTNSSKSLCQALMPIISEEVERKTEQKKTWDSILALSNIEEEKIKKLKKFSESTSREKLNSLFNISFSSQSHNSRGAVSKLKSDCFFKRRELGDLLSFKKEFLKLTISQPKLENLLENSEVILLEFSPACDYSQGKKRINKYILGIMISNTEIEKLNSNMPENYFSLGCKFKNTEDKIFQIILSFNHVITLFSDESNLLDAVFALKKEMMDMIGQKYANHISRVGVSRFF